MRLAGAVTGDATEDGVALATGTVAGTRGIAPSLGSLDLCNTAVVTRRIVLA